MLLPVLALLLQAAPDARLVRYPHVHQNKVAFTYLGDIWTAATDGSDIRRLTVHTARDAWPRFSPDGKWIAFSSARYGNLDVFIVPVEGGQPTRLTWHSAADQVLGWTPDGARVLFSSQRGERFAPMLYTVDLAGNLPVSAGADIGVYASYSPDGTKLAFNRKSQVYWRKGYRGSNQSDVTVLNVANGSFTDLTDFNGMDSWPMWGRDGFIYFVSDKDGNATNLYRVSERGGAPERVSSFTAGDVRWPAISSDGKTIAFEHDFGLWLYDVTAKTAKQVPLRINAEVQENLTESRSFRSEADDYSLAPSGRRIAFSIHGELFTAPVEEGDLRQITGGAARDVNPVYSPDGTRLAWVSDSSGREEVWVAPAEGGAPERISDVDALKQQIVWSPDGKALAYTASDNKLRLYDFAGKRTTVLVTSPYGGIGSPVFIPNGEMLAYTRQDQDRTSDIYMVAATGGQDHRVTFDSYNDASPRFSPDGATIYFRRTEGVQGGLGGPALAQLWAVGLEMQSHDPDDPDDRPVVDSTRRIGPARNMPPRGVAIDWQGLERRTRRLTSMPFSVADFAVAPDGRSIVFATQEQSGARTGVALFTIGTDGRRVNRLASLGAQGGEDDAPAGPGGGGGVGGLAFTQDGRTLYFQRGNGVYSLAVQPSSNQPSNATPRRIAYVARVNIDLAAERSQMFDDAWRTMKYRFYDPAMHGKDWDAMRAKYRPLLSHVGDRDELLNIVNEMIGELNASHTGAANPPGGNAGGTVTVHLGVALEPDARAGRYKVSHIFEGGPADKDWVKVGVGDYLISIDGTPVKAGDNYWKLLSQRLNRRVTVAFNRQPVAEGAVVSRIDPVPVGQFNQLRYDKWVEDRRVMADKLSGGRVGYLHIQAMNQPSLRKFEKELRENRDKEALVIDQRWNGGGNIEQELLQILVQREYQVWQPRGTEVNSRPFAGYFGPKVVLQNWRSASNAEMFPAGFKQLGLGQVIGEPTTGAVIGTGSYSLIDGSTVRTPGVGVYLADGKLTNMENYGVQPDILVPHRPEDELAGKDPQLERAIQELLKKLGERRPRALTP
jgi:tricorn protease